MEIQGSYPNTERGEYLRKIVEKVEERLNLNLKVVLVISDSPNEEGWHSQTYYSKDQPVFSIITATPEKMKDAVKNVWPRPMIHELCHIKFDTLFSPSYRKELQEQYREGEKKVNPTLNCLYYSLADVLYMHYAPQYRHLFKGQKEKESQYSLKSAYENLSDADFIEKDSFVGLYHIWRCVKIEKEHNIYREEHFDYINKLKNKNEKFEKIIDLFDEKLSKYISNPPETKAELSEMASAFYEVWNNFKGKEI